MEKGEIKNKIKCFSCKGPISGERKIKFKNMRCFECKLTKRRKAAISRARKVLHCKPMKTFEKEKSAALKKGKTFKEFMSEYRAKKLSTK